MLSARAAAERCCGSIVGGRWFNDELIGGCLAHLPLRLYSRRQWLNDELIGGCFEI